METELAEVTNQLANLQATATKTKTLLKHAKNPVQNPHRPDLTGAKERVWEVAIASIFCATLVCILTYQVYLYGGS